MADRSVSVPMTLSDLERPNVRNQFFSQADFNNVGWLGQPRHCICTNASRGLSATAGFLVHKVRIDSVLINYQTVLSEFPVNEPVMFAVSRVETLTYMCVYTLWFKKKRANFGGL